MAGGDPLAGGVDAEVGSAREEALDDARVLLGLKRAGGVHQKPGRPDAVGDRVQELALEGGEAPHVVRLPPEKGPSTKRESPIWTSISAADRPKPRAIVSAITVRVPLPMSWEAVRAVTPSGPTATSTWVPGWVK